MVRIELVSDKGRDGREHDVKRTYRVRSAVGGHARAEESTKVLERRRGRGWCGCVAGGGDQKQPTPAPESGGRTEGRDDTCLAGGGGAAGGRFGSWVTNQPDEREASRSRVPGFAVRVVLLQLLALHDRTAGEGKQQARQKWWWRPWTRRTGMGCKGQVGGVGPPWFEWPLVAWLALVGWRGVT